MFIGLECDSSGTGKGIIRTIRFNKARARRPLAAVIGGGIRPGGRGSAPPCRKTSPPQWRCSGRDLLAQRDRLDFQKIYPVTSRILPRAGIDRDALEIA